jgi:ribosomal protein L18
MRNHVAGSETRPRLNVFRSGQHIYAQVIDDTTGRTLVAASSLDETLRSFKPAQSQQSQEETDEPNLLERVGGAVQSVVESAADALPIGRNKSAKSEKSAPAKNAPQKGGGKSGGTAAPKVNLPAAQRNAPKTPVEALAAISNNRKVAISREVGKLVAQRAKERGVKQVVFDRGGYAYHGRIAALAEGAREAGLDF